MSHAPSRGWSASLVLATVLLTGAGVMAACGGGGGPKAAAATPTSGGATAAAYIACLTAHGYPPPANLIQRIEHPPTTDVNGNGGGFGGGGGGFGGGAAGGAGGGPGATDNGGTTRTTLDPAVQAARQAAFTACQAQAPAGVRLPGAGGGGGAAFGAQFINSLRVYISCLNDHGYTAVTTPPTTAANQPPPTGQNQGLRGTLQKIQSDPAAASARQACAGIAPTFPGRGSTTTSTTA